jgi:histidinol-phosphate aminotransferase
MSRYFLPHVDRMAGYQPGEQPRGGGFVKLNTNENPYPPSPRAVEAIRAAAGEVLRKYPDPLGTAFREVAARHHVVRPEMILAGNGSDDLLTILTRAFVGPGDTIAAPSPSYILYRTLAEIQDARIVETPFRPDWTLDPSAFAAPGVRLAFLANPNSPSGTCLGPSDVAAIADRLDCPLVVDEAYADFAETDSVRLATERPNVIVTRSFSKGYSMAGLRLGYLVARPEVVEGLVKVKDSYNCDALSLAGGAAALEDQAYHRHCRDRVLATRKRLTEAVRALGFNVPESQANFVWCTGHPRAEAIYQALKEQKILVRLMRYPGHSPGLRITVGTDEEIDLLLDRLRTLV